MLSMPTDLGGFACGDALGPDPVCRTESAERPSTPSNQPKGVNAAVVAVGARPRWLFPTRKTSPLLLPELGRATQLGTSMSGRLDRIVPEVIAAVSSRSSLLRQSGPGLRLRVRGAFDGALLSGDPGESRATRHDARVHKRDRAIFREDRRPPPPRPPKKHFPRHLPPDPWTALHRLSGNSRTQQRHIATVETPRLTKPLNPGAAEGGRTTWTRPTTQPTNSALVGEFRATRWTGKMIKPQVSTLHGQAGLRRRGLLIRRFRVRIPGGALYWQDRLVTAISRNRRSAHCQAPCIRSAIACVAGEFVISFCRHCPGGTPWWRRNAAAKA